MAWLICKLRTCCELSNDGFSTDKPMSLSLMVIRFEPKPADLEEYMVFKNAKLFKPKLYVCALKANAKQRIQRDKAILIIEIKRIIVKIIALLQIIT